GLKNIGAVAATLALASLVAAPALAKEPPKLSEATAQLGQAPAPTASPNAMVNLINLLVKQGALTREQGEALIKQANDQEAVARADKAATPAANVASARPSAPADGSIRVTYVPEVVKKQLRDEIKQEVVAQAKQENWAQPNTFPEWIS